MIVANSNFRQKKLSKNEYILKGCPFVFVVVGCRFTITANEPKLCTALELGLYPAGGWC